MKKISKEFTTIRQAEQQCKKKLKAGIFEWLYSGAEDNLTSKKNILPLLWQVFMDNGISFRHFSMKVDAIHRMTQTVKPIKYISHHLTSL